jgi:hypothetical protein
MRCFEMRVGIAGKTAAYEPVNVSVFGAAGEE